MLASCDLPWLIAIRAPILENSIQVGCFIFLRFDYVGSIGNLISTLDVNLWFGFQFTYL